jgi:hypothetical protein
MSKQEIQTYAWDTRDPSEYSLVPFSAFSHHQPHIVIVSSRIKLRALSLHQSLLLVFSLTIFLSYPFTWRTISPSLHTCLLICLSDKYIYKIQSKNFSLNVFFLWPSPILVASVSPLSLSLSLIPGLSFLNFYL